MLKRCYEYFLKDLQTNDLIALITLIGVTGIKDTLGMLEDKIIVKTGVVSNHYRAVHSA